MLHTFSSLLHDEKSFRNTLAMDPKANQSSFCSHFSQRLYSHNTLIHARVVFSDRGSLQDILSIHDYERNLVEDSIRL